MILSRNLVLIAGASIALVGCSKCPENGDYDKVPYNNTRTAGLGTSVYDSNCPMPEQPVASAPVIAPAPVLVEPAPIEPQPEPPVFKEQQTK